MTYKMNSMVLLAGLAALLSGCAIMNPPLPSLGPNQFVVIVRGEAVPLKNFRDFVEGQMASKKLRGCERQVPSSIGESAAAGSSLIGEQLLYQGAAQTRAHSGSLLDVFARAYEQSHDSLLHVTIT